MFISTTNLFPGMFFFKQNIFNKFSSTPVQQNHSIYSTVVTKKECYTFFLVAPCPCCIFLFLTTDHRNPEGFRYTEMTRESAFYTLIKCCNVTRLLEQKYKKQDQKANKASTFLAKENFTIYTLLNWCRFKKKQHLK